MIRMIKTAVLSALIGLGGLAALPAAAQADGLYLNYGGQGSAYGMNVQHRDHGRHQDWRRDRERHHDARRDRGRHDGCSARTALNKADRMGVRRARVVDSNRRIVRVAGHKFNHRVVLTFANQRGCPVLR
ncbi:hypothetical protein HNR59_003730 [Aquamicrobium lusatiense]|uniref:Antifreeze protein n=1 Tax=Aquamicrobium lusatiense TaxID=89772 RepID=A0A7W9S574_9HYPH|nr:hypothetical protein [Aquamicrobium lusatiense]MBB6014336.1 hypothetical protein [Aquamicrobium lusatiense]